MIVGGWITQCHLVTSRLCHASLQCQDVLHLLLSRLRRFTHKLEHLHDMFFVGLQYLLVCLIILHIVVTFQRVTALREFQKVLGGFHHVGTHIAAPQFTECHTFCVHLIDQGNQFLCRLHLRHTLQVNHNGCYTIFVLTHRVHAQSIKVTYLLT